MIESFLKDLIRRIQEIENNLKSLEFLGKCHSRQILNLKENIGELKADTLKDKEEHGN